MTSHPEPVDVKAAVELVARLRRGRKSAMWWDAPRKVFGSKTKWFVSPDDLKQAADLIDRLQADNERMVEELAALESFNVNETVWVKLRPVGLEALKSEHESLNASCRGLLGPFKAPLVDDDGWSSMQLWELMRSLGPLCGMARPIPFETTIRLRQARQRLQCSGGGVLGDYGFASVPTEQDDQPAAPVEVGP